jgi:hypothetical protein
VQEQVCAAGSWVDQGTCSSQACEVGDQQMGEPCGACGTQVRHCTRACAWDDWVCTGEHGCTPGEVQEDTQACGACGDGAKVRTRTCGDDCTFGAYSDFGPCSTTLECTPGATESEDRACGACSTGVQTRTRTCASDTCTQGAWSDWGDCQGVQVECQPGQVDVQTQACGPCNQGTQTRTRTCSSSTCTFADYGAWSACVGDTSECAPGAVDIDTEACGTCGTGTRSRQRTCQADCTYGAYGDFDACSDGGNCCGDGLCNAGETCATCADCQAGHQGQGNNGDSCAGVPAEQWRCVTSPALGTTVSQVCRSGHWLNFNTSPRDCAACVCTESVACYR